MLPTPTKGLTKKYTKILIQVVYLSDGMILNNIVEYTKHNTFIIKMH